MSNEVIVMGKVMEKSYTTSPYEVRINDEIQTFVGTPKLVPKLDFVKFAEFGRSQKISKELKVGDFIYLEEDNKNYQIANISTNLDGNIIYFINKVVEIVDAENIEQSRIEAEEWIKEWHIRKKENQEMLKKINLEKQQEKMIEKEVSNMDSIWRLGRNKRGLFK